MNVPDEFYTFCGQFFDDSSLDEDSTEETIKESIKESIEGGVSVLTEKQMERLKKFFSDVLGDDLTDDELADLWAKSPADILFEGPGVKHVMSEALKLL